MTEAAQLEERRTEIDETIDGFTVFSDKDRARAGVIVTIGNDGEFELHQGLIERASLRGAADAGDPDESETEGDDDESWMADEEEDDSQPSNPGPFARAGAAQGMRL